MLAQSPMKGALAASPSIIRYPEGKSIREAIQRPTRCHRRSASVFNCTASKTRSVVAIILPLFPLRGPSTVSIPTPSCSSISGHDLVGNDGLIGIDGDVLDG